MFKYNEIKVGMVARLKDFERRNMPQHWTVNMLEYSGKMYVVSKVYKWDNTPNERLRLRAIGLDTVNLPFFFSVDDIVKANNLREIRDEE